jgi:hypothetical protein
MTLAGEVVVRLAWNGRRVERADVRARTPIAMTPLLAHRRAESVLETLPRIFSLCREGQRAAAAHALHAAGAGNTTEGPRAVMLEAAQEHVFRLLIDAPAAMGYEVDAKSVAIARRGAAEVASVAQSRVLGMPAKEWLALDDAEAWATRGTTMPARLLREWLRDWRPLGRSDVSLMPDATREALCATIVPALTDPGFAEKPTWDGAAVETGPLARMHAHPAVARLLARDGNTVATRMVARLADLAALLARLDRSEEGCCVDGFATGPGEGVGAVQTSRGLLLHRACVEGDRVREYQVVAPTEWNFHPHGPLARGLDGLAAGDEESLVRMATLAVHALDPCVAFRIEVGHA